MATNIVKNLKINKESGTENTYRCEWEWSKAHTENCVIVWSYRPTNKNIWYGDSDSNIEKVAYSSKKYSTTYTPPDNAFAIRARVKPVSKTYNKKIKSKTKTVSYFTGQWLKTAIKYISGEGIPTPSQPSVSIVSTTSGGTGQTLKASLTVSDSTGLTKYIQFYLYDKNSKKVGTSSMLQVPTTKLVQWSIDVSPYNKYCVKAAAFLASSDKGYHSSYSDASDYVETLPAIPSTVNLTAKATSKTSILLTLLTPFPGTTSEKDQASYTFAYTDNVSDFMYNTTNLQTVGTVSGAKKCEATGLTEGKTYFFKVCASNAAGTTAYADKIFSCTLSEIPSAPTTWSDKSFVYRGDKINLYWTHNAADNSKESYADIFVEDAGTQYLYVHEEKQNIDYDDDPTQHYYELDTATILPDTCNKINWKIRTKGVLNEGGPDEEYPGYGPWSVIRTVDVIQHTVLTINSLEEEYTSYPITFSLNAGPGNYNATGYSVQILATEDYTTINSLGEKTIIQAGDILYSKYFPTSENNIYFSLGPGDIDLSPKDTYRVSAIVSMSTGDSATAESDFSTNWVDNKIDEINLTGVSYDDDWTVNMCAYAKDADGNYVEDVTLSIYRINYDGTFTLVDSGITNNGSDYSTDYYPSLSNPMYRVVTTNTTTGAVDSDDISVDERNVNLPIVLKWFGSTKSLSDVRRITAEIDEDGNADLSDDNATFTGNILELPYDVDVTNSVSQDVSFVNYIGRENPVSYYGTQKNEKASWSCDILKDDDETIYKLRQLQKYAGNVYVREPSGVGYWANIVVSFTLTHCEQLVPVTLEITRVEES